MTVEPSTGDLLAPGPLTDAERAAVERAVVRCHVLARLPPPAVIAWTGSVEAAQRYADAAIAGDRTQAPAPVRLTRAGPLSVARRAVVVPRSGALGCAFGVGFGLFLTLFVAALPFWVLGLGPPFAALVAVGRVLRRVHLPRWVLTVLSLATAGGFLVAVFGMVAWIGSFGPGAFVLPEPVLRWLLPATVGLVALGVAAARARAARARLRTTGARPDVVTEFGARLANVPWRTITGPLPILARTAEGAEPDVLRTVAPGWRPFAVHAVSQDGPRGTGPWARLQRAHLRRRRASLRPALRVLWRAYPGLTVVVEPPRELHTGPSGLDRSDGPALVWADGTAEYFLRGTRVPRSPALGDWSVEEIHAVANSEVRRVMIEMIGWEEYLRAAELELVATAPDPGNPPHRLELYELPIDVFGSVRLLVMVNGSPDRTGATRRYAEFVPDDLQDPVEAAAWQYGVDVELYRILERRT